MHFRTRDFPKSYRIAGNTLQPRVILNLCYEVSDTFGLTPPTLFARTEAGGEIF